MAVVVAWSSPQAWKIALEQQNYYIKFELMTPANAAQPTRRNGHPESAVFYDHHHMQCLIPFSPQYHPRADFSGEVNRDAFILIIRAPLLSCTTLTCYRVALLLHCIRQAPGKLRLLPHADGCILWVFVCEIQRWSGSGVLKCSCV